MVRSMDVIQKITKMKEKYGYTTRQLAIKSGIPQSTLQSILKEGKIPSIPTLQRICENGFGITLSQFFEDEEQPQNEIDPATNELLSILNKLPKKKVIALTKFLKEMLEV